MLLLPIILIACVGSAVGTAKEPTLQELHDKYVGFTPAGAKPISRALARGATEDGIIRTAREMFIQQGKDPDEYQTPDFLKAFHAYCVVENANRPAAQPAPVAVRQPAPVVRQAPAKTRCPWCGQISADDTCPHCGGAK